VCHPRCVCTIPCQTLRCSKVRNYKVCHPRCVCTMPCQILRCSKVRKYKVCHPRCVLQCPVRPSGVARLGTIRCVIRDVSVQCPVRPSGVARLGTIRCHPRCVCTIPCQTLRCSKVRNYKVCHPRCVCTIPCQTVRCRNVRNYKVCHSILSLYYATMWVQSAKYTALYYTKSKIATCFDQTRQSSSGHMFQSKLGGSNKTDHFSSWHVSSPKHIAL
jgi:hypothetical protein